MKIASVWKNNIPQIKLEWEIFKRRSFVQEDLSNVQLFVWLCGKGGADKMFLSNAAVNRTSGKIVATLPSNIGAGTYNVKALWVKNRLDKCGNKNPFAKACMSEVMEVLLVTSVQEEGQHTEPFTLSIKSVEATYGYDGLSAYEAACMYGVTTALTEKEYVQIRASEIETNQIADGAITGDKIADGAITGDKLADGAIDASQIVGNIDVSKLADGSITTAMIASGSVTTEKIADKSITGNKLADGAITDAKIANGELKNFETQQSARLSGVEDDISDIKDDINGLYRDKQDVLVSGDNIATINGYNVLNGGNIVVAAEVDQYRLETYKTSALPDQDIDDVLEWSDGAIEWDDEEAIASTETGEYVTCVRYNGKNITNIGTLCYSIDDGVLVNMDNGTAIKVYASTKRIKFVWKDANGDVLLKRSLPVVHSMSVWSIYNDSIEEPPLPDAKQDPTELGWHQNMTDNTIWISQKTGESLYDGAWGKAIRIRGEAGTSVSIKGSKNYESELAYIADVSDGDAYVVKYKKETIEGVETDVEFGHLFVYYDGTGSWTDVGQFAGQKGDSAYVHIKYAKSINPLVLTDDSGEVAGSYLGVYTDHNAIDPDPYTTNYTWKKIEGETCFTSNIFKRSDTKPSKPLPTEGSYTSPVPAGWSDSIPDGDKAIWTSRRYFWTDARSTEWSEPKKMSDTADFDVCYHADIESGETLSAPLYHHAEDQGNGWHNTATANDAYMATATCNNGNWGNWQISKIKGEKGDDGKNGTSISNAIEYYAYGDESSPNGNTWGTVAKSPINEDGKRYIWNRTDIITTDASGATATIAGVAHLINRYVANGIGIDYYDEYYKVTDGRIPIESESWGAEGDLQTAINNLSQNNKYLWNKEVTWYDNGDHDVHVILLSVNGEDISVKEDKVEYAISDNGTTKPSSWQEDVPAVLKGKYLWTRTTVVYKIGANGEKAVYSYTVSYQGVDGMSVKAEYSRNGRSDWHAEFGASDKYMRTSIDGGTTWGNAVKIVGEAGASGDYTDFSFAISANLTTDSATTAPTIYGNWSDAPIKVTSAYPYLWMKKVKMTWDNSRGTYEAGTAYYCRITGETGKNGSSAYEIWLKTHTGSESDYLASLVGPNGLSAYEVYKKNEEEKGNVPMGESAWLDSLDGSDGLSAYDIYLAGAGSNPMTEEEWLASLNGKTPEIVNGYWTIGGTSTGVAATGSNGLTPYIGADNKWYIGDTCLNVVAKGADGVTPRIGSNGCWIIDGVQTNFPSEGDDGRSPYIGNNNNWFEYDAEQGAYVDTGIKAKGDTVTQINGYWYINGVSTGVKAEGLTPYIGENGNWYIGTTDTGTKAKGENGSTPRIGSNGCWIIDGVQTSLTSKGDDGKAPKVGSNGNWFEYDADQGEYVDTGIKAEGEDAMVYELRPYKLSLNTSTGYDDDIEFDSGDAVEWDDGEVVSSYSEGDIIACETFLNNEKVTFGTTYYQFGNGSKIAYVRGTRVVVPAGTSTVSFYWMKNATEEYNHVTISVSHTEEAKFKSSVFRRSSTKPTTPSGGDYVVPIPNGWSDGIPDGEGAVWMSSCIFSSLGNNGVWTEPQLIGDTQYDDYEFCNKASYVNAPQGHPNTNTEWSNDMTDAIWMAHSHYNNGAWSTWKISKIKGEKGATGKDGTSVKIVNSVATENDLPSSYAGSEGDGYIVEVNNKGEYGHLFVWAGSSWKDVGQIKGEQGQGAFVADLSNEIDGVPVNAANQTTQSYTLTTTARIYLGTQQQALLGVTVATDNESVTYNVQTTAQGDANVTFSVANGATLSKTCNCIITLVCAIGGQAYSKSLVFSIVPQKMGANGDAAVRYFLSPSVSAIKIDKNGNYDASSITCRKMKQVGNGSAAETSELSITMSIDGGGETSYSAITLSKTLAHSPKKNVTYILRSGGEIYDKETVPVVIDGADGANGKSYVGTGEFYYATATESETLPAHSVESHSSWKSQLGELTNAFGLSYPYLWNFEIVEVRNSDGTITKTATEPEMISHWSKGVSGVDERYLATTNDSIPQDNPQNCSTSSKDTGFSASKPYLWNAQRVIYEDGNYGNFSSWQQLSYWGQNGYTPQKGVDYNDGKDAYTITVNPSVISVLCDDLYHPLATLESAINITITAKSASTSGTVSVNTINGSSTRYPNAVMAGGVKFVNRGSSIEYTWDKANVISNISVPVVIEIDGKTYTISLNIVPSIRGVKGLQGKAVTPCGIWNENSEYYNSDKERDYVQFIVESGTEKTVKWYIVKDTETYVPKGAKPGTSTGSIYWEEFQFGGVVAASAIIGTSGRIECLGAGELLLGSYNMENGNPVFHGWKGTDGTIMHTDTGFTLTKDGKIATNGGGITVVGDGFKVIDGSGRQTVATDSSGKIKFGANSIECWNLDSVPQKTMWLDDKGNLTTAGIHVNMMQEISTSVNSHLLIHSSASLYNVQGKVADYLTNIVQGSANDVYCLDVLRCGGVITLKDINKPVYLPFYFNGGTQRRTATRFGNGQIHMMTEMELRQLVGKTILVVCTGTAGNWYMYGSPAITSVNDTNGLLDVANGYSNINGYSTSGFIGIQLNRSGVYRLEFAYTYCTAFNQRRGIYYWKFAELETDVNGIGWD